MPIHSSSVLQLGGDTLLVSLLVSLTTLIQQLIHCASLLECLGCRANGEHYPKKGLRG